jgi:hypothetical protein
VLERRHVTFSNEEPPSGRHQRRASSSRNLNLNEGSRGPKGSRGLNRSMSHGRTLQDSPPKTRQRNFTADADWAFQLGNEELVQALSDVSDQNSHAGPLNRGDRHQRVKSALPRFDNDRLERGASDVGLTNPGERARHVALSIKTQAANDNMEEPRYFSDDSNFTSLMYILEKQRDTDNSSNGSQRKTEGSHKSGEGASRIKSNRLSGSRTAENTSFVSRGAWGYRPQRPLTTTTNYVQKHKSNIDHLFEVAEHVEELCKIPEGEEADDVRSSGVLEQENAAFLSQLVASHPEVPAANEEDASSQVENGGVNEQTPILGRSIRESSTRVPQKRNTYFISYFTEPAPGSRVYKFMLWWIELRKQMRNLAVAFDGDFVKERLWHAFQNEMSMIIVPALAVSAFLYYKMNNPVLPVFPTNASVSWWILFLLRHYVTLQASQSQSIVCRSTSFTFV